MNRQDEFWLPPRERLLDLKEESVVLLVWLSGAEYEGVKRLAKLQYKSKNKGHLMGRDVICAALERNGL